MRWIPGHRELAHAQNARDREDIRRNNEVDLLAKKAAALPLPDIDRTDVYVSEPSVPLRLRWLPISAGSAPLISMPAQQAPTPHGC